MKQLGTKSLILTTVVSLVGLTESASAHRPVPSSARGSVFEGPSGVSRFVLPEGVDQRNVRASSSGDSSASKGVVVTDCAGLPDGVPCDDGNSCTSGETCHSGICATSVTFTEAGGSPVGVGSGPWRVSVADFNLDNKPDLAIANLDSSNVTILLGNGSGGFTAAAGSPIAVGSFPLSVDVSDFNLDGRPDIAVAQYGANSVMILLGDGSGEFSEAPDSPVGVGSGPGSIAVSDFNLDSIPDLAVSNYYSGNLTILLGDGSGEFREASGSPVAVGDSPSFVVAGDFNHDNEPDVAVVLTGGTVSILLADGSGGFGEAPGSPVGVGANPTFAATGDFTLDGDLDLVVTDYLSDAVTILLGDGSGGFVETANSPVATGMGPVAASIADFNLDGRPDLAVANDYELGTVTILLGDGSGGFSPADSSPVAVGARAHSVPAGDFNADGTPDIAVANFGSGTLTILLSSAGFVPDGVSCSDGNACTVSDSCLRGSCAGGSRVDCDDADPCTIDSCDPASGCEHATDPSCNRPPDCGAARPNPYELWPPNHLMVPVGISGVVDPDGDPVEVRVVAVSQDEPVGVGGHFPDAAIAANGELSLRAERLGQGNGRVYAVSFLASDGRGGVCQGTVSICVPRDQAQGLCTDDGQTENSLGQRAPTRNRVLRVRLSSP